MNGWCGRYVYICYTLHYAFDCMSRHSITVVRWLDYSKTQRLSDVVVKASDWRARGPGFNTLRCHLYDIIVFFCWWSHIYICCIYICFSYRHTNNWWMVGVGGWWFIGKYIGLLLDCVNFLLPIFLSNSLFIFIFFFNN